MKAVGIVRQSRGREESLSPAQQRERIEGFCEREGFALLAVHEEIDFSGFKLALHQRHGLRAAVEAVEDGSAAVVIVAYFDRLFRNLTVQREVIDRVESAGGRLFAADVGQVSAATAGQWMSSTMLGVVSEYYSRTVRERSGEGQRMGMAAGKLMHGIAVPGYRIEDGRLVPSEDAPTIVEAFEMRADGATIMEVRDFLRQRGIKRGFSGVQRLFSNRTYLGELHFGKLSNLAAHEPIIDRDLWERVQRVKQTRGTRPKSDRLLARLGVLRCGTCGARMVVGFRTAGEVKGRPRYDFYRCPPIGDCPQRVTIGADKVEAEVVAYVKDALRALEGKASAEEEVIAAERALERAQAELDAAIRAFSGLQGEDAAAERLGELLAIRDAAEEEVHRLRGLHALSTLTVDDWDVLSLEERRGLIRETVRVRVMPGRGADRLRFESLLENSTGG